MRPRYCLFCKKAIRAFASSCPCLGRVNPLETNEAMTMTIDLTAEQWQEIDKRLFEFLGNLVPWSVVEQELSKRIRTTELIFPQYHTSLDLMALVEKKIKEDDKLAHDYCLYLEALLDLGYRPYRIDDDEDPMLWDFKLANASPEIKAKAAFEAIGGKL